MILTFHVPPLARDCVISIRSIVRSTSEKFQKNGESWYGVIRPIFRQIEKLELSI